MVAIQGLGGIPEPKPEQPSKIRKDRDTTASSASAAAGGTAQDSSDDFVISSEARAASAVLHIITLASPQGDVRADKVAAAKESLARGDYKNRDLVAKTAERLLKYL